MCVQSYCVEAYNILRHNGNLLITLFFLMLSCGESCPLALRGWWCHFLCVCVSTGIPELQSASDLAWLQEKLMVLVLHVEGVSLYECMCVLVLLQMHVSDEIASDHFRRLIIESLHTKTTLFNDFMHLLKHA